MGHAATVRTALGYHTKPWKGASGFFEAENVVSPSTESYFDGIGAGNGEGFVADPEVTEVNQVFFQLKREDYGNSMLRVGRQEIKLDDVRFIGNVGWRQNHQSYDAVRVQTALGVEGLDISYVYIDDVARIFGDQGAPGAGSKDFHSNSHLARIAYDFKPWLKPVVFAYFLDFDNSPANSSNTYGIRGSGSVKINDSWKVPYEAGYALQTDGGNGKGENPMDYTAHYVVGGASVVNADYGGLGVRYELLGSDDGMAQFRNPLATGHKFSGWADAFLAGATTNGGPRGLQDIEVFISPKLPYELKSKISFHKFLSDEGSDDLGNEIDAVVSRAFGKHVTVLAKVAYFDDGSDATSPFSRTRFWLQTRLQF